MVPLLLLLERMAVPPLWVHAAIWLPLTLVMTLALLHPIKPAIVASMLSFSEPVPVEDP